MSRFAAFQILELLRCPAVTRRLFPLLLALFDRPVWLVVLWIGRPSAAVQSSLESSDFSLPPVEFLAEWDLKAVGGGRNGHQRRSEIKTDLRSCPRGVFLGIHVGLAFPKSLHQPERTTIDRPFEHSGVFDPVVQRVDVVGIGLICLELKGQLSNADRSRRDSNPDSGVVGVGLKRMEFISPSEPHPAGFPEHHLLNRSPGPLRHRLHDS